MCVNQTETSVKHSKYVHNPIEQGVRWTEKYARDIEKLWKLIPNWLGQVIATIAVVILASGLHGNDSTENIVKMFVFCRRNRNV